MTRHEYNEDMGLGYHGLPDARERTAMTVLALAEEMVKHQKDTPAYIVLSHELNLKLAREQAKATMGAGWLAVGGAIAAAVLTFVLGLVIGASPKKEAKEGPINTHAGQPASETDGNKPAPIPAVGSASPKAVEVPAGGSKAQSASDTRK